MGHLHIHLYLKMEMSALQLILKAVRKERYRHTIIQWANFRPHTWKHGIFGMNEVKKQHNILYHFHNLYRCSLARNRKRND